MQLNAALTMLFEVLHVKTRPMPNPRAHAISGAHICLPPPPPVSPASTPATGLGVSVTPSADTLVEKFRTVHAGLVPTFPAHNRLILNHFYELLGHGEKTLDLKEGGEET